MNSNIIKFYMITNRLKEKIRTGWQEIDVSAERLESVAEHVYGCAMLAIAIDSEYELNIDMYKVLKMLCLHELEETIMKDFTIRDHISREEKIARGRQCVIKATEGLIKQEEIVRLLDEYNAHLTKESIFCHHVDKIECDLQVKIYDLNGQVRMEKMIEDLYFHGEEGLAIKDKINTPSDVWIECDKKLYKDDPIFNSLIEDIQKMKKD